MKNNSLISKQTALFCWWISDVCGKNNRRLTRDLSEPGYRALLKTIFVNVLPCQWTSSTSLYPRDL